MTIISNLIQLFFLEVETDISNLQFVQKYLVKVFAALDDGQKCKPVKKSKLGLWVKRIG
jgi:hypothetical protein